MVCEHPILLGISFLFSATPVTMKRSVGDCANGWSTRGKVKVTKIQYSIGMGNGFQIRAIRGRSAGGLMADPRLRSNLGPARPLPIPQIRR
jgi:hypothetical protein